MNDFFRVSEKGFELAFKQYQNGDGKTLSLFPVFHFAKRQFYSEILSELKNMDIVLIESYNYNKGEKVVNTLDRGFELYMKSMRAFQHIVPLFFELVPQSWFSKKLTSLNNIVRIAPQIGEDLLISSGEDYYTSAGKELDDLLLMTDFDIDDFENSLNSKYEILYKKVLSVIQFESNLSEISAHTNNILSESVNSFLKKYDCVGVVYGASHIIDLERRIADNAFKLLERNYHLFF